MIHSEIYYKHFKFIRKNKIIVMENHPLSFQALDKIMVMSVLNVKETTNIFLSKTILPIA